MAQGSWQSVSFKVLEAKSDRRLKANSDVDGDALKDHSPSKPTDCVHVLFTSTRSPVVYRLRIDSPLLVG